MDNEERRAHKSDTLNVRISPAAKAALKDIGRRERRSMANALKWLVVEYFRSWKVEPPENQFTERENVANR
jgi:hypothetical protein